MPADEGGGVQCADPDACRDRQEQAEAEAERPLEAADIAWDRTHPDPYRTWRNGEPPAKVPGQVIP